MHERLKYALYSTAFNALAILPTPVLQVLGSGARLVLEKVMKYRRKVVRDNLRNSFPEKTEAELREIEHDFYSQLADNFVETIKLLHISDAEVDRRITVEGGELVDRLASEGHPVVLYLGHYANWEFVPAIVRHFSVPEICAQVYKPMHDKAFDRMMLKVRSRFNPVSVPQAKVFRTLVGWARERKPFICGFIADHRSNERVSHHEMTFLNQRTQFNPGGEEIGKRINAAYLYLDIEKPRRGHYRLTFKPIVPSDPTEDSPYTREYLRMLEQTIRRRPGLWLWSHRRWKWTTPAPTPAQDNESSNQSQNISAQ